jgi:glycoprotein-N-acetylgalactosamine 3-beta-galactosyltransferase
MWGKVRSIWRYVYDNYMDAYDFFQIGGDDYYLVAENLRHVVSTGSWKGPWNQSSPLYLGGALMNMPYKYRRYCGGGSGYTLNAVALKLMIEKLYERQPCWPHWEASDEDRIIASCFEQVGILCMDTNDHLNETRCVLAKRVSVSIPHGLVE